MKHLDTTSHLYNPDEAETIAQTLRDNEEDGWSYVVVHDPKGTGYSFINIYDEDGIFVGKH